MSDSALARQCALIVPCFNESKRLRVAEYVSFLQTLPSGFHLVFVDDGSTDDTLERLEQLRSQSPDAVLVVPMKQNAGKAEAVRCGMTEALDRLRPAVTGFWDADLATPLPAVFEFLAILEELSEIQMVFGARVQLLGRSIIRKPQRHYLGRVFATVVSTVLRLPVYDTQCGAKLFRATPDLREVLREPFLSRWIFDVEIIARFIQRRGVAWVHDAVYEYPLQHWEDIAGSKVKAADFAKASIEILGIYKKYLRRI